MLARFRGWVVLVVLAALGAASAGHAAEPYPTRPLRIIVPYPPGGSTDPTARAYGNWLSDKFGVPVVIDNRPGRGVDHRARARRKGDA